MSRAKVTSHVVTETRMRTERLSLIMVSVATRHRGHCHDRIESPTADYTQTQMTVDITVVFYTGNNGKGIRCSYNLRLFE